MATIPRQPRLLQPSLAAPSAPVLRPVADMEPERGYLSRELLLLASVDELTGEEDLAFLQDGKARRGALRLLVGLLQEKLRPQLEGRTIVGGGGGRHTFERSVSRSPLEAPSDTDEILAVRDGQAIRLAIGDLAGGGGGSDTAAEVLAKLLTVDGAGSGLDADLLDGQSSAYYADIVARLGYTPLNATSYTAADVLTKIKTVDGAGSGLDADLLDGMSSAAFAAASHTHAQADVTNLVSDLALKAPLASPALTGNPTAPTQAANDNSTKIATTAYADAAVGAVIAAADAMVFKGVIDASANPNYPASDRGHTYKISVAGKIGGASGPNVEVGDTLLAITDGTAAGTHAAVGANWNIVQANLDGAVIGPASVVDDLPAIFDGTSGKLIKSKTYAAFKTLLVLVKGDVGLGNVDNTSDVTKNAAAVALTNKTVDLASNTLTGTKAQFNTAMSDADFATLAGVEALTNKDLTSGTNTFPTLNQNTTGSAAKWTTARNVDGQPLDGTANITVIAPGTHAATSKATPVDADELPLVDSAASNVLKRLTWANLKATLKTYFDTLYASLAGATFTGAVTATQFLSSVAASTSAHVDASGQTLVSIGASANSAIAPAGAQYFLVAVSETSTVGDSSLWLVGNGVALLVGGAGTLGGWVASTTGPAAGKYSVAHNGTAYAVYNGSGATRGFKVLLMRIG